VRLAGPRDFMERQRDAMIGHEQWMAMAIEEARLGAAGGEQPFGSVIVRDRAVICRTRSLKVSTSDTTAHSELLAVRTATQKLNQRVLDGCVFYATCEPCPMCLGAILNAGINHLVIGARKSQVRQFSKTAFRFNDYTVERFAEMVGWPLVVEQALQEQCIALYADAAVELTR
jgi:tRNA(adenine34) deaminase